MADALPLACACGTVCGRLAPPPPAGLRCVCYCCDCRAYAERLSQPLLPGGGSPIYQTVPSRVAIDSGRGRIAALRMTGRGVFRFYAACCGTPLANTAPADGLPILGLMEAWITDGGQGIEAALGPVRFGVFRRSATEPVLPRHAGMKRHLAAMLALALGGMAGGHRTSPFFEAGRPITEPEFAPA